MGTLHQNQQPMETGPLDMPALIRTLPELTFDETMDERADMTCKGSTNSRNSYRKAKRRTRAVGFFGRLKIEFFYGRDWSGVTLDEFADMLDAYLRWYRDVRLKSDLGYRSPMQYRRDLRLIA